MKENIEMHEKLKFVLPNNADHEYYPCEELFIAIIECSSKG